MFDYSYLETLHAVQTEGTYERAANVLGVTRSAISQRIQLLEERWGSATISRKPVQTTKLGLRLCRHLDQIRMMETRLFLQKGDLFDTADITPTNINLCINRDLLPTCFLDNLALFADRQRAFMFQTAMLPYQALNARLLDGEPKSALCTTWTKYHDFAGHHLGTQTLLAVASPAFIAKFFSNGLCHQSLLKAPSVCYSSSTNFCYEFIEQHFNATGETRTNLLPSNHGIQAACLKGKAWAMVPSSLATDHIRSGKLVDLVPGEFLSVDLYWYVNRFIETVLPEVTQTVLKAAENHLIRPESTA